MISYHDAPNDYYLFILPLVAWKVRSFFLRDTSCRCQTWVMTQVKFSRLQSISPWRKLSTAFSLPSSLELQRPFSALLYHTRLKSISVNLFHFRFNRSTLHWTIQTFQKIKISLLLASVVSAWDEPGKPPGEYRLSLYIYSFFRVSHHQSLSLPSFNSPVSGL